MTECATRSPRATASRNERGSSYTRRRRKQWLLDHYRADVDAGDFDITALLYDLKIPSEETLGTARPACRCYRCGVLLVFETVTVDRIVPGRKGGTYRRNNIRPACFACNRDTGRQEVE